MNVILVFDNVNVCEMENQNIIAMQTIPCYSVKFAVYCAALIVI